MTVKAWLTKHTAPLCGKRVAISGATGGLGQALVKQLASLGADLVFLDRNHEKSASLAACLQKEFPDCHIRLITVDLSDMASVKQAAMLLSKEIPDHVILNAGAYHIPRSITSCGYDNVFTINCLAPYYLVKQLYLPIRDRGGRIVAVGSIAHTYSKFDPEDPDFRTRKKASLAYGNAKRCLMYALDEGFKDGETVVIAHPGITFTNITAHYPKVIFALIKHPMKVIFQKPKKACLSILDGLFAVTEKRQWIGPRIFGIWGLPKISKLKDASDGEAKQIAEAVESMYQEINR